jgi:arginyl-tRNA synthetase
VGFGVGEYAPNIAMIRDHIHAVVRRAISAAQNAGALPAFDIPDFNIERPRQSDMGDYAVSIAMQLARQARQAPPKIAAAIAGHIPLSAEYSAEVVAGYINFRLSTPFLNRQVDAVLEQGMRFGNVDLGGGQKAQVEHGSANPTGYATIGTGRNVTVGDTLANTLEAAGYDVHREWYINDRGAQIARFGASLYSHYCTTLGVDEPLPPNGYPGEDVVEVARILAEREGNRLLNMPKDEAKRFLADAGVEITMAHIKDTMARLGVRFDNYFSENSLHTSGEAERMLGELRERDVVLEHDGAVWFSEDGSPIRGGQGVRRDDYADDGDGDGSDDADAATPDADTGADAGAETKKQAVQAVIFRSPRISPNPEDRATYFFSDVPYVWDKMVRRGFNPAVYVWGEDHQADVPRLYAIARVLGLDEKALKILIYRFITVMRGGKEARMGKRAGNAILINDVLDEIGKDATRFTYLSRSIDTKIVFDLDLLKEQSDKNPVYYVQYGHARICSIGRRAPEMLGRPAADIEAEIARRPTQLEHVSELALIRKILELPEIVALVANTLQPHHYTTYAYNLCAAFSKFYDDCPIFKEPRPPEPVMYTRLRLARAAQIALARVLALMGMDAPERM